jgi:hypothetical protein
MGDPISKITQAKKKKKRAVGVVQVEALSSNPSTASKTEKNLMWQNSSLSALVGRVCLVGCGVLLWLSQVLRWPGLML